MKHTKPITVGNVKFDCYKKQDEYVVRVMVDGKRNEERCYYTDDRADALGTMKLMVEEEKAKSTPKPDDVQIILGRIDEYVREFKAGMAEYTDLHNSLTEEIFLVATNSIKDMVKTMIRSKLVLLKGGYAEVIGARLEGSSTILKHMTEMISHALQINPGNLGMDELGGISCAIADDLFLFLNHYV